MARLGIYLPLFTSPSGDSCILLETLSKDNIENVMSFENLMRFCSRFSVIPSHLACKMCANYPGIKMM